MTNNELIRHAEKQELNRQLREVINKFINEHKLSCENCIYFNTKSKTHCNLKCNCIMEQYNDIYINYTKKD